MSPGISVLHVDDEPGYAEMGATLLEDEDEHLTVETATSAAEGLDRLAQCDVDCVISDYDMPEQNGLEFLEAVRERYPDLPFILHTGKGSEEVASEAISAGVTDYLQKESGTSQFAVLANRIGNVVAKARAARGREQMRERMELALAHTDSVIFEIDLGTSEIIIHGAFEETTGQSSAAIDTWTDFLETVVHPDDEARVEAFVEALLNGTRDDGTIEYRIAPTGDEVRWMETTASLESAAGRDPALAVGITRDVTAYKERERELEETNALLSTLVDALPQGILVEDADRCVLVANRRLVELLAHESEPADLVGADCARLTRDASALFADPGAFVDRTDELVAARASVDDEELALADGRTYVRTHRPVELPDGDGHLWMYDDVTDRKARERDLELARDLLEQTERIASVGGWEIDTETMEVFWTEHLFELLGVDYDEEPPLEEALDVYHEADRPRVEAAVEEALATGEPFDVEVRFVRPDGEVRWLRVQGSPTMTDGEVQTLRGAVQDVTERKQHERLLERQNARLEEFTSVVSHDLRSPLSVAQGRLELAQREVESPHLESVADAHNRMQTLIEDLLTFAREGETPADTEAVDLAALAEDCWRTVETDGATLRTPVEATIRADESRLRQVFENLFRNAVEHGSTSPAEHARQDAVEHGSPSPASNTRQDAVEHGAPDHDDPLTVTVGGLDDGFYVEDDGTGIDSAVLEEVFEAGFSTSPEGVGFGLSIVRQVAEAHDWEVRVVEGSDGGARFEVTGVAFPVE